MSPLLLAVFRVPRPLHVFPRRNLPCRFSDAMIAGTRWSWSGRLSGNCSGCVGRSWTWNTPPGWTRNVSFFFCHAGQESGGTLLVIICGRQFLVSYREVVPEVCCAEDDDNDIDYQHVCSVLNLIFLVTYEIPSFFLTIYRSTNELSLRNTPSRWLGNFSRVKH